LRKNHAFSSSHFRSFSDWIFRSNEDFPGFFLFTRQEP
jgi:hypothetical protein